MSDETNSVLLDEERRMSSRQEVKVSIDNDVNARIRRESARVEPDDDPTTRNLIEDILKKEEEHAHDLSNMLETFDPEKAPALVGESYLV